MRKRKARAQRPQCKAAVEPQSKTILLFDLHRSQTEDVEKLP